MQDATPLHELLADYWMELALPKGTVTYRSDVHGTTSTIDLVFVSEELTNKVISCDATDYQLPGADHFAINTVLDLQLQKTNKLARRNFCNTDWPEFRNRLIEELKQNTGPRVLTTPSQIDQAASRLTMCFKSTIEAIVPHSLPSSWQNRWWTKELTKSKEVVAKLSRRLKRDRFNRELQTEFNRARNQHKSAVTNAKNSHWKAFLADPDEGKLWTACKMIAKGPTDGSTAKIPPLQTTNPMQKATSNDEKSKVFFPVFFPPPPSSPAALDNDFPIPLPFTPPTTYQLRRNILKQSPYKAPGPDGIPNVALRECIDIIIHPLHSILTAILKLQHFPTEWLEFSTIVVRKPGKPDYTAAKAYRPIALFKSFYKVLTSTICEILSDITERHELLPPQHFCED